MRHKVVIYSGVQIKDEEKRVKRKKKRRKEGRKTAKIIKIFYSHSVLSKLIILC